MSGIFFPDDGLNLNELGGKARALALLSAKGFPIPPWFVVTPRLFYESLNAREDEIVERFRDTAHAAAALNELKLDGKLEEELRVALKRLSPGGGKLAVRSSASEEDSVSHSFAGQLESSLGVSAQDVPAAILAVWRSGFSEKVYAYLKERKISGPPKAPAVLVQQMVASDSAGVAFSADPVTGERSVVVVSAVFGLGASLASGESDGDTWRVEKSGEILSSTIAVKQTMQKENGESAPIPAEKQSTPSLTRDQVVAVASLARRAEIFFSAPQDIEWAYEAGKLYLLQARPITTLSEKGEHRIWDNSNIAESYGGVTTPLTFSFARNAYEAVYLEFCRLMKVPESVLESRRDVFRCMLGFIQGRLYYNLLNWYRLLAMLPGFKMNRGFMEQMMGVKEKLPDEIAGELEGAGWGARLGDGFRFLAGMGGLVFNYFKLESGIRSFYARLDEALGKERPDFSKQSAQALVAHYRDLERKLLRKWDAPLVNDFFAMVFFGLLRKLCSTWCGDKDGTLQNDLVSGEGKMISRQPAEWVKAMSEIARKDPDLAQTLLSGKIEAIEEKMKANPPFHEACQAYLEKFGDRCTDELKLESLTLLDNPLPLLRSIGELAVAPPPSAGEGAGREALLRKNGETKVKDVLSGKPHRKLFFNWILTNARARVRDRENLRFERTRVFGRVRQIFLEIGKRFQASNLLDDPRDIFFLEMEEIFGFLEGTAASTDLKGISSLRKKEFEAFSKLPSPPDRFETDGIVYENNFADAAKQGQPVSGQTRRGIGCCPGKVRGKIQVVKSPQETRVCARRIFAAERTDPSWIMIFPLALGVLVQRGSLLSHAAIVAREMGIPTVVAVEGLLGWVRDGEWVEMDGAGGTVRKLNPEEIPVES